jgi:hypothetical protein
MTDENLVDPMKLDSVSIQLNQGTFTAIDQKKPLLDLKDLSGWMSLINGSR